MDIFEVDFGIANTYSDRIEINKHLIEFPTLREKIIKHELEHSRESKFWKHRKIDALTEVKFRDLFPFIKKYPKYFFQQYFPFTYRNKTLYIEWSLLILYSLGIGFLFLIYFLINLFSNDSSFFWRVIKYMAWILGIISLVYFGGKKLIKIVNSEYKKEIKKI